MGHRGQPTPYEQAALARHLIAQLDRSAPVAGGLAAHAEIVADKTLRLGAQRLRARLVMVYRGKRQGAEWLLPTLRAIELTCRDASAEALAKTVVTPTNGTIAIRGGAPFDAESGVMRTAAISSSVNADGVGVGYFDQSSPRHCALEMTRRSQAPSDSSANCTLIGPTRYPSRRAISPTAQKRSAETRVRRLISLIKRAPRGG